MLQFVFLWVFSCCRYCVSNSSNSFRWIETTCRSLKNDVVCSTRFTTTATNYVNGSWRGLLLFSVAIFILLFFVFFWLHIGREGEREMPPSWEWGIENWMHNALRLLLLFMHGVRCVSYFSHDQYQCDSFHQFVVSNTMCAEDSHWLQMCRWNIEAIQLWYLWFRIASLWRLHLHLRCAYCSQSMSYYVMIGDVLCVYDDYQSAANQSKTSLSPRVELNHPISPVRITYTIRCTLTRRPIRHGHHSHQPIESIFFSFSCSKVRTLLLLSFGNAMPCRGAHNFSI